MTRNDKEKNLPGEHPLADMIQIDILSLTDTPNVGSLSSRCIKETGMLQRKDREISIKYHTIEWKDLQARVDTKWSRGAWLQRSYVDKNQVSQGKMDLQQ